MTEYFLKHKVSQKVFADAAAYLLEGKKTWWTGSLSYLLPSLSHIYLGAKLPTISTFPAETATICLGPTRERQRRE